MTKAQDLFNKLKKSGLLKATGSVDFHLMHDTRICDRSVVGNVMQDWLSQWMENNKIPFDKNTNSQEPTDFYLNKKDKERDLLEMKCFDGDRGANFDIGNFIGYCTRLKETPYKLNSDYLILAYKMDQKGLISISDIWLKKVWEICGESDTYPIKVQAKKGEIVNIRPIVWFSKQKSATKPFANELEFLKAIDSTLRISPAGNHLYKSGWLKAVKSGYEKFTGKKLV